MSPAPNYIGGAIGPAVIVKKALDHVKTWLPTYVAHIAEEREMAYSQLPTIRTWSTKTRFDNILGNDLPLLAVNCPGMLGQRPDRHANGYIDTWWVVGIGVVLPGRDDETARDVAEVFGVAIRKIFLQHPDMGDFADSCVWEDERYDDLRRPGEDEAKASVRSVFSVLIAGVDDWTLGPPAPNPDDNPGQPFPDSPLARSILVDAQRGG